MAETKPSAHTGRPGQGGPFERLFLDQYERVVLVAYKILGDRHAAEDVAQEVFMSFHGRITPDEDWAPGWLWSASAHRALNVARGDKRRRARELRVAPPDGPSSPEDDAIAEEQWSTVRAALGRLPPRQAAVLALRASGLCYADIAMAVGAQPGSVGTLICRAQRALRKELTRAKAPF